MTITAFRITKKQYALTIWSGIGAREFGGRWNAKGRAVIYTAESRALAAGTKATNSSRGYGLVRRWLGLKIVSVRHCEQQHSLA